MDPQFRVDLDTLKQRLQHGPLSLGEQLFCGEVAFALKHNGEADVTPTHLQLEPHVKFAFMVTAKTFRVIFKLDTGSQGWDCLVRSRKVRNRLTHPKRPSDLELSAEELADVIEAYKWFDSEVGALMTSILENVEKTHIYLKSMLELAENRQGGTTSECGGDSSM